MAGIPLEDALKTRLENSTREELLAYCEELGISDVRPTADLTSLKNRIFTTLGVVERAIQTGQAGPQLYRSKILPPMNLTPSGLWGGRRRRIRVPRPAWATKNERAMPVGWNGKATYWLPFNEPIDVPYPIYNILRQTKTRRPIQIETDGPGGTKEITTGWEFEDFTMEDMGDTPGQSHLPCSLTEWYQEKGPRFFMELSGRDAQMVADRLDINTIGHDKKRVTHNEVVDLILIFLYGVSSDGMELAGAGAEGGNGAASEIVDPMTT